MRRGGSGRGESKRGGGFGRHERRRRAAASLLHCVLRTGKGRGTEKRKWTWRSTRQRGCLSGDVLAGVTRGDADVEIGEALEAQLTEIE